MNLVKEYLPAIYLAIGYGGIVYSLFIMTQSVGATKWEQVKVNILTSNIATHYDEDGSTKEAILEYSYQYNGTAYTSNKIAFGYSAGSRTLAHKILKKYAQGESATAYLNPRDPQSSVLLVGILPFHLVSIIFFIIFTLMAHNKYIETISNDSPNSPEVVNTPQN